VKFASTVDRQRRHLLLASLATAGARSSWARQDPGAGNRKLYLYNGPDREEKLLAAARKEGKASSYTSLNTRDSGPITEAFEKKYGIKTAVWRASSEKVVQRAVTEARSGRHACDVLETNGPEMEVLYREKLLAQFHSPHFKDLPAAAFPPHRHYLADRFNFFVIAWNTNLVKPDEVPNSYQDLVHPRFAGRVADAHRPHAAGRTAVLGRGAAGRRHLQPQRGEDGAARRTGEVEGAGAHLRAARRSGKRPSDRSKHHPGVVP
jgi:spermidine/putrescine-binding protein